LHCPEDGQIAFVFAVDRGSFHFLRFRSTRNQALSSLEIRRAD